MKMPKNYDFTVKNVNWKQYERDYILRTDAVWEKSKLKDIFYILYKTMMFDKLTNKYFVSNIRMNPFPTNEAEHMEDWVPFIGYNDIDGLIWEFNEGPKVMSSSSWSHFIADKEGDAWYLCFIAFQKFMICNDRSPVKVDEANLFNGGLFDYPCYSEFEAIGTHCGPDLFEPMWEVYKLRVMQGTQKPPSLTRTQLAIDPYNTVSDRKVLHY